MMTRFGDDIVLWKNPCPSKKTVFIWYGLRFMSHACTAGAVFQFIFRDRDIMLDVIFTQL